MKSEPNRAGFTLVEILVVVVLLGIAAAVVVPQIASGEDFQVRSAARMLASDLQYAQSLATTTQSSVTVSFVPAGSSYSLSNASGTLTHPITKDAYNVDFRSQGDFSDLEMLSADFGGNSLVSFDSMGIPSNPGSVVLQAGPHVFQVDIAAATGRITVSEK